MHLPPLRLEIIKNHLVERWLLSVARVLLLGTVGDRRVIFVRNFVSGAGESSKTSRFDGIDNRTVPFP